MGFFVCPPAFIGVASEGEDTLGWRGMQVNDTICSAASVEAGGDTCV